MKTQNLVLGFLTIALVCTLSAEASAQRKFISGTEYYRGISASGNKQYEKSRRVVVTDETFEKGATTKSMTSISEILLPDHRRYYQKTTEGDKITEYENITIDYMQYTRINGGAWMKLDLRQNGGLSTGSGSGVSSRQCEQYSVEPAFLNGIPMQLFESLNMDSNDKQINFREARSWIGDDGMLYRQEEVSGNVQPREETRKILTTYEYDPNIKIEAPIK